jgi:type I restriction enzyme S subunit
MNWSSQRLGDYCEVIAGQSPEGRFYNVDGEGLPFYQGKKEFRDRHIGPPMKWTTKTTKEASSGDILMSVRAPVGPVNFSTQRICIGRGLAAIRPSTDVDKNFLFYFLLSKQDEILGNEGAVFSSINKSQIEALLFPYVELKEQKHIVTILDQAFADIEQARANTTQNLKNARELFNSYLQQVFSQRDSEWAEYKMADVCQISSKLVDPKENQYSDLLHVGAGNIASKSGELFDVLTAKEEGLISGKFVFDESMILYSKIRPYLMKVCRPTFAGLCSADIYPLSPIEGRIDKDYLFYLLLSKDFTDYAIAGSGRAGMPKVNRTHLFNYTMMLPSVERQREHVVSIDKLLRQTQKLEDIYSSKLAYLGILKSSLLQKAFTGELTKNFREGAA